MSDPNSNKHLFNAIHDISLHNPTENPPQKIEAKQILSNDSVPINSTSIFSWPNFLSENNHQHNNFMDVFNVPEFDMTALMDEPIWAPNPSNHNLPQNMIEPVGCSFDGIFPWNPNLIAPPIIKEEWNLDEVEQQMESTFHPLQSSQSTDHSSSYIFSMAAPVQVPSRSSDNHILRNTLPGSHKSAYAEINPRPPIQFSRNYTPSIKSLSESTSSDTSIYTPPSQPYSAQSPDRIGPAQNRPNHRRRSTDSQIVPRTYRRRTASHPSVASVVSLSAHEPVSRMIDGVEHITFLYSHDRLVKEYTVRTDVINVSLGSISLDFRALNSIYPRANVPREEYDGNRWEYETSCNKLGWEICWLNQNQLCGRRGLIQRAVDAYRNRHAEMRSRRVTRQEKVANGTLRKRRAKKMISPM
ncbi:hypothetical protein BDB01DRAFT_778910 [Pilobolus umbonatus]|nr:hypothetical protein BDB01DRAFT_778910 [Pilobolus umbonatus]